jgi:hypothetical protein
MSEPKQGSPSPWGPVQIAQIIAPGIVFVSTAGHGGFWLSFERQQAVPPAARQLAEVWAPPGWYEEDCCAVIPAIVHASDFVASGQAEYVAGAIASARKMPKYVAALGTLLPAEGGDRG